MSTRNKRLATAVAFVAALKTELPGSPNASLRRRLRTTAMSWANDQTTGETLEQAIGKTLEEETATRSQKHGAAEAIYCVLLDSYDKMEANLLMQIVADAGSVRKASEKINVPRQLAIGR